MRQFFLDPKEISTRLAGYVAPERKGVRKGDKIGMTSRKYHGTLLAMTELPLKRQAEIIGVSYGALRKWRTERNFWKTVKAHCR